MKLTVTEAAIIAGLSPSRIRQFCIQGRIPAEKLGHQWAINRSALDRFLKKKRKVGPPFQNNGKG